MARSGPGRGRLRRSGGLHGALDGAGEAGLEVDDPHPFRPYANAHHPAHAGHQGAQLLGDLRPELLPHHPLAGRHPFGDRFGLRLQHTAVTFHNGDTLMVSPGVGVQILPNWDVYVHPISGWGWGIPDSYRNTLYFVYGDVDISWLHDFSPHFGFELGMKLGVAGLAGGNIGKYYPRSLMIGPGAYPFVAFYSGFRF